MSNKISPKSRTVTVKLEYPFEWAGDVESELVAEVTLSRPKGKHLKGIGKDVGMADIFRIASKVSGFTPAFFDEMDAADCISISEVIGNFLDNGKEIGKTT